uniref:WD-repeat protein n=1 Tax=Rhizophora mucronata TaxID=61149 RepID=A0A2P2M607_RHIMU
MGRHGAEEEEEEQFFDSFEQSEDCSSSIDFDENILVAFRYDFWIKDLESVSDRRRRFLEWMGLDSNQNSMSWEGLSDESFDKVQLGMQRMVDNSGAILGTTENGDLSSQSTRSSQSNEAEDLLQDGALGENFVCKIKNLDDDTEFMINEADQDGMIRRLREVSSNRLLSFEEFQRTVAPPSPLFHQSRYSYENKARDMVEAKKKEKSSWLRKFSSATWSVIKRGRPALNPNDFGSNVGARLERVKVQSSKKRHKELSSLFCGQEIVAHKGSILTLKFSLDGQYLASGGEDSVVRVWQVTEDDTLEHLDTSSSNPSCSHFNMSHLSKLASLDVDKKYFDKMKRHRASDSTCVIIPPRIFGLLEKPLHEFQGHGDDILDLSWSKERFLLSSSADKTVRLWQVGCNRCLRVFYHYNYVSCVDFNPSDDNYFISGSIDGKVRIWEVLHCQVVDYTDIRDIVTALHFFPDGKGAVVGSMKGCCFFYDIIDNQLQLNAQICLQGKKKLPAKRITGFEISPTDPSKIIVASADSLIRVLCGTDIVWKFRASSLGIAANHLSASFTSDGKHVVSTSEDSSVHFWNCPSQERTSHVKSISSFESFMSQNASIAIPWRGIKSVPGISLSSASGRDMNGSGDKNGHNHHEFFGEMLHSSLDCFSLARGFLLESLTRGAATWPEEKLPDLSSLALLSAKHKPEFKFLKSACQSMFSSHMWGLVIVTAGWDGRIRTFLNYGLPLRL